MLKELPCENKVSSSSSSSSLYQCQSYYINLHTKMEPSATAFTLRFGCSQCTLRGFSPIATLYAVAIPKSPQSRVPVAVLEVRSPSASHFVWLGDITSPAAMIGCLKLKACHTQTPRIAPLAKVAVDNAETVCSR